MHMAAAQVRLLPKHLNGGDGARKDEVKGQADEPTRQKGPHNLEERRALVGLFGVHERVARPKHARRPDCLVPLGHLTHGDALAKHVRPVRSPSPCDAHAKMASSVTPARRAKPASTTSGLVLTTSSGGCSMTITSSSNTFMSGVATVRPYTIKPQGTLSVPARRRLTK